jgi:hypothetical protein
MTRLGRPPIIRPSGSAELAGPLHGDFQELTVGDPLAGLACHQVPAGGDYLGAVVG